MNDQVILNYYVSRLNFTREEKDVFDIVIYACSSVENSLGIQTLFYFYKKYLIFLFYKPSENEQKWLPGGDFEEEPFLKKRY